MLCYLVLLQFNKIQFIQKPQNHP